MFPSWDAPVKFPNWPGPVKLPGVTEVGRRDAWPNRNELILVKAVVIVARTTPTKVAKYAYLICRSILVNNLHLAARLVFKKIKHVSKFNRNYIQIMPLSGGVIATCSRVKLPQTERTQYDNAMNQETFCRTGPEEVRPFRNS